MRSIPPGRVLLRALVLFLFLTPAWGQKDGPSEYDVKAAFLLNFAKFVTWPTNAFESPEAPLVITVVGDNPFGRQLHEIVRGRTVEGRRIDISHVQEAKYLNARPHLLFVAASERREQADIVRKVLGRPVLTVGESDGFLEAGGVLNFRLENNRVRFEVNTRAAETQNLKLSSKLISVAIRVIGAK